MRLDVIIGRLLLGAMLAVLHLSTAAHAVDADTNWKREHARDLDARFAQLSAARSKVEANRLESQIWTLWNQSGCEKVDALMLQAQLALRQGQHKHAIDLTSEVIELLPRYPEGWNLRATVLFFMGDGARSAADIAKTLELEPRHFGALAGLTTINMRAKNWPAAYRSLQAAMKVHPYLRDGSLLAELKQRAGDKAR